MRGGRGSQFAVGSSSMRAANSELRVDASDEPEHRVILSEAKDLKLRRWRSFAVFAAQDDTRRMRGDRRSQFAVGSSSMRTANCEPRGEGWTPVTSPNAVSS